MLVVREKTPSDFLDKIRQFRTQNSKNSDGIPTLCIAILKFCSAYLVEELIKDGVEVNAFSCVTRSPSVYSWYDCYRRWGNFSAIHLAASLGQHQIVRLLLEHGADLKSKTTEGIEVLDLVLNPFLFCEVKTTESDDLELLKLINENGLDLNKKDGYSRSVLHRAIIYNCPKIAGYLISIGCNVNCVDKFGCSPLHDCKSKSLECGRLLLDNNVDPNVQDDVGNTVYHHILGRSNFEDTPISVTFLDLLHKFRVDPNIQNDTGKTALHEYIISKDGRFDIEVIDIVLQNGADPSITDIFERTASHYLVLLLRSRDPHVFDTVWAMLTKLVLFGANLNCRDITGTPLFHVLVDGCLLYPECFDAKLWIEILRPQYKVDVNVQDFYNRTALHLVSAKGDWKLSEVLLRYGGNMNVLDCDGNTPLDVAILCKQWDYARKLLIWPSTVDESSHFNGNSSALEPNSADHKRLNDHNSKCKNSNNTRKSNGNNSNKLSCPEDNDKDKGDKNLWHFLYVNENQNPFGMHDKLQRIGSISSFKPRKQKKACIFPLAASFEWTKTKLDTVAKFLAKFGNEFNFTCIKHESHFWYSDLAVIANTLPRINEKWLTQINKSTLLHLCAENSLQFHMFERCEEEHCLVAQQVFGLVSDLLQKCSEIDPRMSCELHWTGSSSEGTKMWFPDEFDFLVELIKLRGCCSIKNSLVSPKEVIVNPNKRTIWLNLCSGLDLCVLSPKKLRTYLSVLLWKAAFALDKERYPNIHFNLCRYSSDLNCFLYDTKVGVNLTVSWKGKIYKNLTVSIDLTPGVPVAISEKQMSDLHESARKELSDRWIHVVPYVGNEMGWRASFSLVETRIVRNLTNRQISLYKCLKLFRDLHEDAFEHIPSYHLKTFLLGTLFHDPDKEYLQYIERECFYSSVCLVLFRLKQIIECPEDKRSMQHFFLKRRLHLLKYDVRWCKSILDHLESS